MTQPLLRSVDDGVAVLTFNRPEAANTWSPELHVAYLAALRDLSTDDDVRAVVVTGAGRHFCAGADMALLDAILAGEQLPPELASESFLEPMDFPKPLVAAVNGSAAGIGFIHALLSDIRFASEEAVFTTSFAQRGLVAEHGVSWLLPQVVGRGVALDLLLSARRVHADEAHQIGLVHRVVPGDELLAAATEYARALARSCSPAAMSAIKHQVTRHATLQFMEAELETLPLVEASLAGADFAEGVQSFLDRRPAAFAPLGRGTVLPRVGSVRLDAGEVAEAFFVATSSGDWATAHGLLAPHATVATHPGSVSSGTDGLVESWQQLRDLAGPWEYTDVRRIVDGLTFCEQHRARFLELDVDVEACVVATIDDTGRIIRLEEYADGRALRAAVKERRAQREAQPALAQGAP
ncbi:enoyl-CoA hydratase-related protein [Nocardioides litoris]|uniref:enoyl-CoA hydratase-related protein n=1 Tax=Nocardioides litoris TaxID=1926648 RepID=UPI001B884A07|nr:enoyl-CoA hydratase-related protein [Nocardioides litoris]